MRIGTRQEAISFYAFSPKLLYLDRLEESKMVVCFYLVIPIQLRHGMKLFFASKLQIAKRRNKAAFYNEKLLMRAT